MVNADFAQRARLSGCRVGRDRAVECLRSARSTRLYCCWRGRRKPRSIASASWRRARGSGERHGAVSRPLHGGAADNDPALRRDVRGAVCWRCRGARRRSPQVDRAKRLAGQLGGSISEAWSAGAVISRRRGPDRTEWMLWSSAALMRTRRSARPSAVSALRSLSRRRREVSQSFARPRVLRPPSRLEINWSRQASRVRGG